MMEQLLLAVAKQFNPDITEIHYLTKCRNTIYKALCPGTTFILRLTEMKHRNLNQIESELDFQSFLYENNAPVSKPLKTVFNKKCILVSNNSTKFIVCMFEYVKGKDWDERNDKTKASYYNIGKALGKIHSLSIKYVPTNMIERRKWYEQQELLKAPSLFRKYSFDLYSLFLTFMSEAKEYEINSNNFGLTHGDYLCSNYLFDDLNNITVIDFDECEYSWFASDLAICMRCYLMSDGPLKVSDKFKEAEIMHYYFLKGYKTENKISKEMVYDLERLFRIRDFIELSRMLDQEKLNKYEKVIFDTCFDRIVNQKNFLLFDISKSEELL